MQILARRHNVLHRQVILCLAGSEALTEDDSDRLHRYGLGESVLGSEVRDDRVPTWLEKWASLICKYLDEEESSLKEELLERDPLKRYTEATAAAEAKGVVANRVQNVAITLDKVRMFLRGVSDQPQTPPLRLLTDDEVVDYLWSSPKSVGRRIFKQTVAVLAAPSIARAVLAAESDTAFESTIADFREFVENENRKDKRLLEKLCDLGAAGSATTGEEARSKLWELVLIIRQLDVVGDGILTAAADIGTLYAGTRKWIMCERGYKGFTAAPVKINLQDVFLNREEFKHPGVDHAAAEVAAEKQVALLAKQHKSKSLMVVWYSLIIFLCFRIRTHMYTTFNTRNCFE